MARKPLYEASEITIEYCEICGKRMWFDSDIGWCCPECDKGGGVG